MKLRQCSNGYLIVLALLFCVSITLGIFCILYERQLEGFIILGCAFVIFALGMFLSVTQISSDKQYAYAKAGNAIVTNRGYLVRPNDDEQRNVLIGLHDNGVFIDYSVADYEFIPYADITAVTRINSRYLTFFVGSLMYEMMASSEIKRLAFESVFSTHGQPVFIEEMSDEKGDTVYADKS